LNRLPFFNNNFHGVLSERKYTPLSCQCRHFLMSHVDGSMKRSVCGWKWVEVGEWVVDPLVGVGRGMCLDVLVIERQLSYPNGQR